jgi:hypothetical protein
MVDVTIAATIPIGAASQMIMMDIDRGKAL